MVETRTDDIPQISEEENALLTVDFSEEEVLKPYLKWNITNRRGRMGFPRSFINDFGRLFKRT
jgi:hypothetical protein